MRGEIWRDRVGLLSPVFFETTLPLERLDAKRPPGCGAKPRLHGLPMQGVAGGALKRQGPDGLEEPEGFPGKSGTALGAAQDGWAGLGVTRQCGEQMQQVTNPRTTWRMK